MLTPSQETFLKSAAAASVVSEIATGLPADLSLAQAIFESSWGAHSPGRNCFGLKANGGKTQLLPTTEWFTDAELARFLQRGEGRTAVLRQPEQQSGSRKLYDVHDLFAAYDSLADCFTDHARLITQGAPYAKVWAQYQQDRQLHAFIIALGSIYATAPNYGLQISGMTLSPWFQNALDDARREAPITPKET